MFTAEENKKQGREVLLITSSNHSEDFNSQLTILPNLHYLLKAIW